MLSWIIRWVFDRGVTGLVWCFTTAFRVGLLGLVIALVVFLFFPMGFILFFSCPFVHGIRQHCVAFVSFFLSLFIFVLSGESSTFLSNLPPLFRVPFYNVRLVGRGVAVAWSIENRLHSVFMNTFHSLHVRLI